MRERYSFGAGMWICGIQGDTVLQRCVCVGSHDPKKKRKSGLAVPVLRNDEKKNVKEEIEGKKKKEKKIKGELIVIFHSFSSISKSIFL